LLAIGLAGGFQVVGNLAIGLDHQRDLVALAPKG
jgi:hypothetical protein